MRKAFKAASIAAMLAALVLPTTGAHAAASITGTVTGKVIITTPANGIPLDGTCVQTAYDFDGVAIQGTLSDGTTTVSGLIDVQNVHGAASVPTQPGCTSSAPENLDGARGNVNNAPITGTIAPPVAKWPATCTGVDPISSQTVVCRFWGVPSGLGGQGYTRDHTLVNVDLTVQFCFNKTLAQCFPGGVWKVGTASGAQQTNVHVTAQFNPSDFNGTAFTGAKEAQFAGSFNN